MRNKLSTKYAHQMQTITICQLIRRNWLDEYLQLELTTHCCIRFLSISLLGKFHPQFPYRLNLGVRN